MRSILIDFLTIGIQFSLQKKRRIRKSTHAVIHLKNKKSFRVAKEIQECKKDLVKLQKMHQFRKHKYNDRPTEHKSNERRKQNLEILNDMLKKRSQNYKKKIRNQEKLLKKDLKHFERSIGASLNKKRKQK